jgi:hypothetical protein
VDSLSLKLEKLLLTKMRRKRGKRVMEWSCRTLRNSSDPLRPRDKDLLNNSVLSSHQLKIMKKIVWHRQIQFI